MSESGNGRLKPRRKATRAATRRGSRSGAARPTPAESSPPTPPEPPRYAPRTSDESPFWATAQSAGAANQSPFWANTQSTPGAGTQPIARPTSSANVGSLGDTTSARSYTRTDLAGAATTTAAASSRTAGATPASGGGERGGSRAAARSGDGRGSGARRPLIAIASVILVITPISWILLHEPQNDDADASIPIVGRTDDRYVTPTAKPVVNPPSSKVSTPATPTATPTNSAAPTSTPSTDPTDAPTSKSTEETTTAPTKRTPTPDRTTATRPTAPSTTNTPPPPARDGGMEKDELQLFDMIDAVRVANGCAPLEQDPGLTDGARSDAEDRSTSASTLNASGSSMTAAGGDKWNPRKAYDQMMAQSSSTVLNCNLKTLGVGKGVTPYCKVVLCMTGTIDRVAWVADFM